MNDVTFQTDDRYSGPILGGRYQVMASAVGPTFYVYDHQKRDALRDPGGSTKRFENISSALATLGFTTEDEVLSTPIEGEPTMSKRESEEVRLAKAAEADRKLEDKIAAKKAKTANRKPPGGVRQKPAVIVKAKPPKKVSETVSRKPKEVPQKVVTAEKPKRAPRVRDLGDMPPHIKTALERGEKKPAKSPPKVQEVPASAVAPTATRPGTVRRLIEDLIWVGGKTDAEIHDAVVASFPNNSKHARVSWYRADMKRKGVVFPTP